MDPFQEATPLWDLSHASNFSQLPDDDFLALLQKQFPPVNAEQSYAPGVNPQSISQYPLPSLTPPSEDSSPSPPNLNSQDNSEEPEGSAPKRKASSEELQEGPSQKSQHTRESKASSAPLHVSPRAHRRPPKYSVSNDKKGASTTSSSAARRKSSGTSGPAKDETRLLKRKEQNRAAQRAFRERKEKHVKDLEDKVAALEAKNEQALHENENLRDLLNRLQNENVILKQSSFTFSMPKAPGVEQNSIPNSMATQSPSFSSVSPPSRQSSAVSPSASNQASPKPTNPIDWSSLTSFDPNVLNLLDDSPQPTATEGAMHMDFGFGESSTGLASNAPYTTIASNPMFMSFAHTFDTLSQPLAESISPGSSSSNGTGNGVAGNNGNGNGNISNVFNFDINSLSTWSSPPGSVQETTSLDDLFAGWGATSSVDLPPYLTPSQSSISPVAHHSDVSSVFKNTNSSSNTPLTTSNVEARSPATSSSSSPSSSVSDPSYNSPRESSTSDSDALSCTGTGCPKTKTELTQRINSEGPSPFAPSSTPLKKSTDNVLGTMITCAGSSFPKTQKSDKNVEVLSAWRSITQNPNFKGVDINELCHEFTSKARCDGTKVVLEPQGVHSILENLAKKQ
ncbi:hypothetical protein BDQ17DRAFT_1418052 [Cyathus striatus]|nr:hypothetical protein BDQ17DRAFT_1418052 [Cyathus striatus]